MDFREALVLQTVCRVAGGVGRVTFSELLVEAIDKTAHFTALAAAGICECLSDARHC